MTITLTIHAPDDPPSDKNTVIIWTTSGFSTWWQTYWDGARWRDPDTGDIINQDVTELGRACRCAAARRERMTRLLAFLAFGLFFYLCARLQPEDAPEPELRQSQSN